MSYFKHYFLRNAYRFLRHDLYRECHFRVRHALRSNSAQPALSESDKAIVEGLQRNGFYSASLESLALESSGVILKNVEKMEVAFQSAVPKMANKTYTSYLSETDLFDLDLHVWGLEERLLYIVEAYLGEKASYRGLLARAESLGDEEIETRLWHRDPEDSKILKIIIYLNDVDEEAGPFECFKKDKTLFLNWAPKDQKGRLEKNFAREYEKKNPPHSFIGKKGTVVFVDTCQVYHRGKKPVHSPRRALFYCYNAKKPAYPIYCDPHFSVGPFLSRYSSRLTQRQRHSLPTS